MSIPSVTTVYGTPIDIPSKNYTVVHKEKINGLVFPVGSSSGRGYFQKQSGVKLVKNNLQQLLRTERGERVMLPDFGISLKKYLFEPLDEELFKSIQEEIIISITKYMSNVRILRLSVTPMEKYGISGSQALLVSLVMKIKEPEEAVFESKETII